MKKRMLETRENDPWVTTMAGALEIHALVGFIEDPAAKKIETLAKKIERLADTISDDARDKAIVNLRKYRKEALG